MVLRFALMGASLTDVDAHRAELLTRIWSDCMPPAELTHSPAIVLWCRVRAGGTTRDEALAVVDSVLADPHR